MLNLKRLCSVFLIVMLVLSSVSVLMVNAQTEMVFDETNEPYFETVVSSDDEVEVAPDATDDESETVPDATDDEPETVPDATDDEPEFVPDATDDEPEFVPDTTDDEVETEGVLPSAVDNSLSVYFPPVCGSTTYIDQKAIDSAVFATVYYQFTFEMNKLRGVESTKENTFSPIFVYHIINKGIQNGSALEDTYNFLKNVGCATDNLYYYDESLWDNYNYWPSGERLWREALKYRMDSSFDLGEIGGADTQITSPDDTDLTQVKTSLNNGKLITFSTNTYGWYTGRIKAHEDAPENEKYEDEKIAYLATDYLDSLTWVLVGYNDNIWCDVNNNNIVDAGEMGAFKAVNTWGNRYNTQYNDGFCWIAYDAFNETSAVEGASDPKDRTRCVTSMKTITVKEPLEEKEIYVLFELDYGVRSEFEVKFTAEKDGVKYEKRFLPDVNYLVKGDNHRFNSVNCVFLLSDLVPGLTNENFEEYNFEMTVADYKEDSFDLRVSAYLVNEFTGERNNLYETLGVKIEDSEHTVKIQNNVFVYYIGFDNPVLYYKTGEGDFIEVPMAESREKRGYYYKYFIEGEKEATLYFSNKDGKLDDNSGEYFTAKAGYNYYATEGQREPLTVVEFGLANGLPDINTVTLKEDLNKYNYKTTRYFVDYTGGYGPYYYRINYENLDTGAAGSGGAFYNFDSGYDLDKMGGWSKEGNYKVTIEIKDWRDTIVTKSFTVEVKNRPFEISSITMDKENYYLSETIEFTIDTSYMNMKTGSVPGEKLVVPKTTCIIKDSDGKIVWAEYSKNYSEYSLRDMATKTHLTYKPMKAGEYTLTVSSTDVRGEYAEKTITFVVLDKTIGDANGDGTVNIKDATIIQKYIAGLATKDEINIELADCDGDTEITIKDATSICKYIANIDDCNKAGEIIEYIPEVYTVRFENVPGWEKVYCEIISPNPELQRRFPGEEMTACAVNEDGVTVYELQIPEGVTIICFNDGGYTETLRIDYSGGDKHYYPIIEDCPSLFEVAEKQLV